MVGAFAGALLAVDDNGHALPLCAGQHGAGHGDFAGVFPLPALNAVAEGEVVEAGVILRGEALDGSVITTQQVDISIKTALAPLRIMVGEFQLVFTTPKKFRQCKSY